MHFEPVQFLASVALFGVGIYCLVMLVIARGGWRQLASKYAANSKPPGVTFWRVSGCIPPHASYTRCLNVVSTSSGIYVEARPLVRLFHQPLFFPWQCVSALGLQAGEFSEDTQLQIQADDFSLRLRFPESAAAELRIHLITEQQL